MRLVLGGKEWLINEPVFKDLKIILSCLNRLNKPASDERLIDDVQLILSSLIGEDNVKKFKRSRWEAWKIPAPTPEELAVLFAALPDLCGLQAVTDSNATKSNTVDEWDALYWRIIRLTGWTWDTVDTTMTMSKLMALNESLNISPSTDSLVAAYLGYDYTPTDTLENKIDNWLASQGLDNG